MTDEATKTSQSDLGKFWTVPNVLSMVRLVLVFPMVYLILVDGRLLWILGLVLLAIATDYFDGRVARWSHTVSAWGKVLDPLADKVAGGLVVGALVLRGMLPLWFVLGIIVRDLLIFGGGIIITRRTGTVPSAHWSGKITVTAIAITVLAALLKADPEVLQFCLNASTALLGYSFLVYLVRFIRAASRGTNGTGPAPNASEGG